MTVSTEMSNPVRCEVHSSYESYEGSSLNYRRYTNYSSTHYSQYITCNEGFDNFSTSSNATLIANCGTQENVDEIVIPLKNIYGREKHYTYEETCIVNSDTNSELLDETRKQQRAYIDERNQKMGLKLKVPEQIIVDTSPSLVHFNSKNIILSNKRLTCRVLKPLLIALASNIFVSTIDLSNNPELGNRGLELISNILIFDNPSIEVINLAHTNIGRLGVMSLVRGFRMHRALKAINLSGNIDIDDSAAIEVGNLLTIGGDCCKLEEIVLMDTSITSKGVVNIAKGLMKCTSMLYMPLPHHVGTEVLTEIELILKCHRRIHLQRERGLSCNRSDAISCGNNLNVCIPWSPDHCKRKEKMISQHLSHSPVPTTSLQSWCNHGLQASIVYLSLLSAKADK
eukprot:Tbor_TRINITY_DN2815_c0_g1::TRINITY_DN2815_c0_g1_i1::g.23159::m.23159